MRKTLLLSCLLFTMGDAYADLSDALQQQVNKVYSEYHVNAAALSVGLPNGQAVNAVSGTYNKDDSAVIDVHSLFQVGAITQNLTAAIMLQLVAAGKVSLADPIGKYLPQYPDWQAVTLQQLLNHTSGIYDYDDVSGWWLHLAFHSERVWRLNELADKAYDHDNYFRAGTGWHYSNTDYILLGLVAEKVTGQSMQVLMNALLQKYHLTYSYYWPANLTEAMTKQYVQGYYNRYDLGKINASWAGSGGALLSNPADLVVWAEAVFNGQVLAKAELQTLLSFVDINTGKGAADYAQPGYGMGVFRQNTPVGLLYIMPGTMPGYQSVLSYMPCTGLAVAYSLSSPTEDPAGTVAPILTAAYQQALRDPSVQKVVQKYQKTAALPGFCRVIKPAGQFQFPTF